MTNDQHFRKGMWRGSWWVSLLATGALCAVAGVALERKRSQRTEGDETDPKVARLQQEVQRLTQLRAQERAGRTNAEREAREVLQRQMEADGYTFDAIGYVESCFAQRRGTPRQGSLVPAARARIKLRSTIPPSSLECLDQFSHVWVIFVFHENTNLAKAATSGKKATFPAKIAPPRLGGKKVGLFSTRTPHRPNSIGLTLARIESVSGRTIEISGHDLVNGTPVLDVKPYVFADCISDHICPSWVGSDTIVRPVEFSQQATQALETLIARRASKFYTTIENLKAAITQMLVLDIRSVHQGRGQADADQIFLCHFDTFQIEFQTLEDRVYVVECVARRRDVVEDEGQALIEETAETED